MQSNIHIHAEYRITLSDYRKAVYCALVIRRHRLFLCMLLILAAAFIYAVGRFSGLFPVCYPLVFVAAAELIWGLVLFAGAEKSVRAYMRTPNNYLGAAFAADFEDLRLHIQSPEHGVNLSIPWTKVYCVLEYSSFFSVYLTPQETCIIPRRALSADDEPCGRCFPIGSASAIPPPGCTPDDPRRPVKKSSPTSWGCRFDSVFSSHFYSLHQLRHSRLKLIAVNQIRIQRIEIPQMFANQGVNPLHISASNRLNDRSVVCNLGQTAFYIRILRDMNQMRKLIDLLLLFNQTRIF